MKRKMIQKLTQNGWLMVAKNSYVRVLIHEYMKTITIRDDIYKSLRELKRSKDSFSEVIRRLLERKNTDMSTYFGILRDSSKLDEIEEIAANIRESARMRT